MAQSLCSRTFAPVSPALATSHKSVRSNVGVQRASLPRRLAVRASADEAETPFPAVQLTATALAANVFSTLASAPSAAAAGALAELAVDDARPLSLLVLLVPALGWVLFNILRPGLNQLDGMVNKKSFRAGAMAVGASAAAASAGLLATADSADAAEMVAQLAAADNRLVYLSVPLVLTLGWVLFNILRPALNQLSNMTGQPIPSFTLKKPAKTGTKKVASLVAAAGLLPLTADSADAAQEVASLAADNRPLVLLLVLVPALGWVLFNILRPALNQVFKMLDKK